MAPFEMDLFLDADCRAKKNYLAERATSSSHVQRTRQTVYPSHQDTVIAAFVTSYKG